MALSGKRSPLLGGKTEMVLTDTQFGVVHPKHPDFSSKIGQVRAQTGIDVIVAQKLGFNTKITDLVLRPGDIDDTPPTTLGIPGYLRTKETTDGLIIPAAISDIQGRMAALIMVGDSGAVRILAPDGRLAVLNLSLECIDNKDGTSIVTNAIDHFRQTGIDPSDLQIHIGEAAMACCYGHDANHATYGPANQARGAKLRNLWGKDVIKTVVNPPRKGHDGIDMPLIAAKQAENAGVPGDQIIIDPMCTSHEGLDQASIDAGNIQGMFYSELRGAPKDQQLGWNGRGALMTWGKI